MMYDMYDNKNIISELRNKLLYYVSLFEPNNKDLNDMDYDQLLAKYRDIFCTIKDQKAFNEMIKEYIDLYKQDDPETTLSDIEIIYADDILNPLNFIGLLTNKITAIRNELSSLQKEKDFLKENPDEFMSNRGDYETLLYENGRKTKICLNYIKKCQRIMEVIQEEYNMKRER